MEPRPIHQEFLHRKSSIPAMILAAAIFLSSSACGNGNMFNGVSGNGTGTLAGAESVAATDIKNSNYSAAISALQPYCPQNTCPDTTSTIILSDAYLATGTSSNVTTIAAIQTSSTTQTGLNQIASASLSGEDSNQILETLIAEATGSPTAKQTLQSISQAISCVTNNTCTADGVKDLQAAIELLVNAGLTEANCQSGTSSTCDAGLASMYMIDVSAYIMTAISYQSGLIYNTALPSPTFELCTANYTLQPGTAGTANCTQSLSASAINTALTNNSAIVDDICNLLYNGATSTIDPCTAPSGSISALYTTIAPPGLVEVLPTILSSLGATSAGQTVTNSAYEFLNTLLTCTSTCTSSTQETAPTTAPNFSNILSIVSNYMAQI